MRDLLMEFSLELSERKRESKSLRVGTDKKQRKGWEKGWKVFFHETTMEKWTVRRATMKITDRGNGMKL